MIDPVAPAEYTLAALTKAQSKGGAPPDTSDRIQATVSIEQISKLLGHSSIENT